MNWGAISVGISALTLLATVIAASYTHGKLTQRVEQNSADISDISEIQADHGKRLNEHDVALGRLKEWKEGFNAASRVSGSKEMQ